MTRRARHRLRSTCAATVPRGGVDGPWLGHRIEDAYALQGMLQPCPAEEMTAFPISTLVNSPRNESPECIVRLSA